MISVQLYLIMHLRVVGHVIRRYHGWADDGGLNPGMSIDYYNRVEATLGAEETRNFYKLYMVPGMFHCSGGFGPDTFDVMTEVINWVEKDIEPQTIEASQFNARGDEVVRTRPLCPYPEIARYDGTGDPDDAENFSCVVP